MLSDGTPPGGHRQRFCFPFPNGALMPQALVQLRAELLAVQREYGSVPRPVDRKPQMDQHRTTLFHVVATVRAFGPQRRPSVWPCGAFPGINASCSAPASHGVECCFCASVGDAPPFFRYCGPRSAGLTLARVFTPRLTSAWPRERRFRRTDVGVATGTSIRGNSATGTSIPGNLATGTSIPRKESHTDARHGESGHAGVNLEERRHANVKPKDRDSWGANHGDGPGMPRFWD